MNEEAILKLDMLAKLKKMGRLNPVTANMLLFNPKETAELVGQAYAVHEMFSLPFSEPEAFLDGNLKFANTQNQIVGINIDDLLQGLIIGSPGSGKSILTYHLALQAMEQGAICWMFVKGNDAEKLIKFYPDILVDDFIGQIRKNLFPPPPNYRRDFWNSIHLDIFIQAITLYDGTKNFLTSQYFDLFEIYKKLNAEPSFYEIHDFLKSKKFANFSRDARYNESALNRIGGMLKGSLRKDLDCSSSHLQDLIFQNTIFNYKGLSAEASVYVINSLIAWLAAYKEANGTNKTHLIILDDAMFVFDANRLDRRPDMGIGYINHILFETRKYKIKFLVDVQIPSLVSKGILGTSNFKVLMNIPNANEVKFILDILGVQEKEQREYAMRLDSASREILVKLPNCPDPFLANIPESPFANELNKIRISKEEKTNHNKKIIINFSKALPRIPYHEAVKENFKSDSQKHSKNQTKKKEARQSDDTLDSKARDFLMAVNLNQYKATLTQIYALSNLPLGTGYRIAKACERNNMIKIIKTRFGKGSPSYPVLLPDAYSLLGIKEKKFYGKGAGIEHVLYQHLIKNHFSSLNPTIELNRGGKFIDVGIILGENLIAIEVAMTVVNEKANIEKDINVAKADFVIVACKDEKVKGHVEKIAMEAQEDLRARAKVCLIGELLKISSEELVESINF